MDIKVDLKKYLGVVENIVTSVIVSKKWEKEGKSYNTVQLAVPGLGFIKQTFPEERVPDIAEGKVCKCAIGVSLYDGKITAGIIPETITVFDVE